MTSAYRRRVRELHPDTTVPQPTDEQFELVLAADNLLRNPARRARYDRSVRRERTKSTHTAASAGGVRILGVSLKFNARPLSE
ncbi:DnaJ domain-containing protein [Mycobacterium sp. NPDC048908]|uniref:DnaJ domain-containing protein n=1 Tax=Mycobacterium sp. NPDC048908 TaxID=3364292 RepID=UPI00372362B0